MKLTFFRKRYYHRFNMFVFASQLKLKYKKMYCFSIYIYIACSKEFYNAAYPDQKEQSFCQR